MKMKNVCLLVVMVFLSLSAFSMNNQSSAKKYESVVLTFDQNSSSLTTEQLQRLKASLLRAREMGIVEKTEMAVWSDKGQPRSGDLSKADRKLAGDRIKNIKSALKGETSIFERISTYNMTDNSHWIGRTFNSEEAELDAVFAKNEMGPAVREDFNLIKRDGGPSKAVIIFKLKDK